MPTKKSKHVEKALSSIEKRKVDSITEFDICVGDIISTKEDPEICTMVEHIYNDRVYIYQWGQGEQSPLRLHFTKEQIRKNVSEGLWTIENNVLEMEKGGAIFPDDPLIDEAKKVLKKSYESGGPCKVRRGNNTMYYHKIELIEGSPRYFWSQYVDINTALFSSPHEMSRSNYNSIIEKLIEKGKEGDWSLYVDNKDGKAIFLSKQEVEKYYEIPDYDAVKWVD